MTNMQTDTVNDLLRGEIAATETYVQALQKIDEEMDADELRQLMIEHRQAANSLRQYIRQQGEEPEHDSGAWGTFAKAVEGTAKFFGKSAALLALKEGEQAGVRSYENALRDDLIPSECRTLILTRLLPQTHSHVFVLDRMMEKQ